MQLRLLVTGGTIDKSYDLQDGTLQMQRSHVHDMLSQARITVEIEVDVLLLKISTQLTASDIKTLIDSCQKAPEDRLIITHGTDTLANTAQQLAKAEINKTIVLVGAVIPYIIEKSDALFNLGCAITAAQLLPSGV